LFAFFPYSTFCPGLGLGYGHFGGDSKPFRKPVLPARKPPL